MDGPARHREPGRVATFSVIGLSLALMLASVFAFPSVEAYFAERAKQESQATLGLVTSGVHQAIRRFGPLPELIAEIPLLRTLLLDPQNQGVGPYVNEKLRLTARSVDVSDIYLMDRSGLTIAASNYREERSFVGQRFEYRPYFQGALGGELAQFHALGTTSGEPGFFFAAPVLDGIEIVGVLAVKVTTDAIEKGWAGGGREILVADGNGVIFLTSRPDLRFRSLAPLTEGARQRIAETRQFPLEIVRPMSVSASVIGPGTVELQIGDGRERERYLTDSVPLELPGWHAIVLTPFSSVLAPSLYVLAFWILGVLVVSLIVYILLQRRARQEERIRLERLQREELENAVRNRTEELRTANKSLRSEVAERQSAEQRLRRTQNELVQAGKLAGLGQMSAALSHEINQPLAAVKTYADNAVTFLERSRVEEARSNLSQISRMADRMAKLSGHLRNFARRPGDRLGPVPVMEIIDEAVTLVEPIARNTEARILVTPSAETLWVVGGRLRLQQVLINLLTNALDAMAESANRQVEVSIDATPDTVTIGVRDHGPGIASGNERQVFEPFFTTKQVGAGLGLGLSISFNIVEDFGGKLTAETHPEGGALFKVSLQRAESGQVAAQLQVAE